MNDAEIKGLTRKELGPINNNQHNRELKGLNSGVRLLSFSLALSSLKDRALALLPSTVSLKRSLAGVIEAGRLMVVLLTSLLRRLKGVDDG